MMPPQYENENLMREAYGIAYRLDDTGVPRELYRTKGWYSFEVYVSRDAKFLVEMNSFPVGQRPHRKHRAIAFYSEGRLIKSYSTAELVKDERKVRPTVSHYLWLARNARSERSSNIPLEISFNNVFSIETIDGWLYDFDVTTGEIRSAVKVPSRANKVQK